MALRHEIADRHEIEQHDREAERRQIGRAAAAPADRARGEQLERIDRPADDGDEDLRILQRHGIQLWKVGRVGARLRRPDGPDDQADRQADPSDDDGLLVHPVEDLERRQAGVEDSQMLRLDLLEQEHVGDPDDTREREAGVGEQQRRDVDAEERTLQYRRPRLDAGIERRDQLQRHQQRKDEDAHRPFVGRHLGIEVGDCQQPHECRDRGRGPRDRQMPVLDRLHADHEGVAERGEHE